MEFTDVLIGTIQPPAHRSLLFSLLNATDEVQFLSQRERLFAEHAVRENSSNTRFHCSKISQSHFVTLRLQNENFQNQLYFCKCTYSQHEQTFRLQPQPQLARLSQVSHVRANQVNRSRGACLWSEVAESTYTSSPYYPFEKCRTACGAHPLPGFCTCYSSVPTNSCTYKPSLIVHTYGAHIE